MSNNRHQYTIIAPMRFILLHWLLDQPNAQEFTKYIGQQSPAPGLKSALAR